MEPVESVKTQVWRVLHENNYSSEDAFEIISMLLNNMTFNEKAVAKMLANQHPTLQQNTMRLAVAFISEMAQKEYTDLRNEASVQFAQKVDQQICRDDGGFYRAYFPHV